MDTQTKRIHGDGGKRKLDFRNRLLPGPRSSKRNCSLALANSPDTPPDTPGFLFLETSTWANVLGDACRLSFSPKVALSLSLLMLERVEGACDSIVLMLVPGRGEGLP